MGSLPLYGGTLAQSYSVSIIADQMPCCGACKGGEFVELIRNRHNLIKTMYPLLLRHINHYCGACENAPTTWAGALASNQFQELLRESL